MPCRPICYPDQFFFPAFTSGADRIYEEKKQKNQKKIKFVFKTAKNPYTMTQNLLQCLLSYYGVEIEKTRLIRRLKTRFLFSAANPYLS